MENHESHELTPTEDLLPPEVEDRVTRTHEDALQAYQRFSALMDAVRVTCMRATKPQDWIDQGGGNLYFQGTGAERIIPKTPWISYRIRRIWREETDQPEIPYLYLVEGDATITIPGCPPMTFEGLQGGRGCDKFFRDGAKGRGGIVNPLDVRKAAETGWRARVLSSILGFRGLTRADLVETLGADFEARVKTVERFEGKARQAKIPVGQDTEETRKDLRDFVLGIETRLAKLLPDRQDEWPDLLESITWNPNKPEYAPRNSLHGIRSEPAANWIKGALSKLTPEQAAARVSEWREGGHDAAEQAHKAAKKG